MEIKYDKLWHLLLDKKMTKENLRKTAGISTTSMSKLRKGENITTEVLLKICRVLECDISDIMETTDDIK